MSTLAINEWLMLAIVIAICGILAGLLFWSGADDDGAA
jgi:hypothetical protein